ncbi:hypothetical protein CEXT_717781 [Caerostris extrusa]|uniref:Uncharacterized protein n=1 Tax=Caerostris extrusa TaxID=172846 RepID=A0AAV4SXW1_CAEEX|nr:hypothetical protein CEXT_717781 [Caerostris extrusa]
MNFRVVSFSDHWVNSMGKKKRKSSALTISVDLLSFPKIHGTNVHHLRQTLKILIGRHRRSKSPFALDRGRRNIFPGTVLIELKD